jgi:acetyl-CoA carboxylase carboxyl transferase subunit alpha
MLEHSIYSVISPEGAASILWHDSARASEAATAMRITAAHLQELGVIDKIIPEPVGGAHRARKVAIETAGREIAAALMPFKHMSPAEIRQQRRDKFLAIGRTLGA